MRNNFTSRAAKQVGLWLGVLGGVGGVPLIAMLLMLFLTACASVQEDGFEIQGEIPMESRLIITR